MIHFIKYFGLLVSLIFAVNGFANEAKKHAQVTMRMIGHELLHLSGNDSARVLPIEVDSNQFIIRTTASFHFDPGSLAVKVDSVMGLSHLADGYIVEVKNCDSNQVVYSYERSIYELEDLVPCKGRTQPEGCYYLVVTIVQGKTLPLWTPNTADMQVAETVATDKRVDYVLVVGAVLGLLLILAGVDYVIRQRRKKGLGDHVFSVGEYQFDTRNMTLSIAGEKTELTSKESELLEVLYDSVNETVERNQILKEVWGDEGDYIGRTLDVFVSKLRKKLEGDQSIKIINVRGVGYRLVLGDIS